MSKNPVRNYAIDWIRGHPSLTDEQRAALLAAVTAPTSDATGDVFGDVSGSLLGPLIVMGLLGSAIDGPASDGTVLRYDEASDSWIPVALASIATDGMVPYYIAPAETFTVPEFKQAPYAIAIDVDGTLAVNGILVEVD